MNRKTLNSISTFSLLASSAIAGLHISDGLKNGINVEYKNITLKSHKIIGDLDGYKIVFITDIHNYPESNLNKVVAEINKFKPDLCVLGGDFAEDYRFIHSLKAVSKIITKDGIYGIEGNHDNSRFLFPAMKSFGIQPLCNEGIKIKNRLYLGGVADYHNQKCDVYKALEGASIDDFSILLCHNPDTTMMQDTSAADITLSGHIHGGEATFFGIWAPALTLLPKGYGTTNYGQYFMSGHVRSRYGANVYVSRGLGCHLPFRIYAPREVTFITLKPSNSSKSNVKR